MKPKEIITLLNTVKVNQKSIDLINDKYKTQISDECSKVICLVETTKFYDNDGFVFRQLPLKEILGAEANLHVDFLKFKLIPFFDVGENDYICYMIDTKNWCKFNIVDETIFSKEKSLDSLLPE